MIPKAKALNLITIYLYICELNNKQLAHSIQRYSNNDKPGFTDHEIMTIYLYVMQQEQRFRISHIYSYADQHLRSWFPLLPSYQAFNTRLDRLPEAFKAVMLTQFKLRFIGLAFILSITSAIICAVWLASIISLYAGCINGS